MNWFFTAFIKSTSFQGEGGVMPSKMNSVLIFLESCLTPFHETTASASLRRSRTVSQHIFPAMFVSRAEGVLTLLTFVVVANPLETKAQYAGFFESLNRSDVLSPPRPVIAKDGRVF